MNDDTDNVGVKSLIDRTGMAGGFKEGLALAADHIYAAPEVPVNTNDGPDGKLALVGAVRPAPANSDWGSSLQFLPGKHPEEGLAYVVALQGATLAAIPEPGTVTIAALV